MKTENITKPMTPFEQGMAAFKRGKDINSNPYAYAYGASGNYWHQGFQKAQKEFEAESLREASGNATVLTRTDNDCGAGSFDSIKWAFEVHLKEEDKGDYDFAILYGNQDSPVIIDFYVDEPNWNTPAARTWIPAKAETPDRDAVKDRQSILRWARAYGKVAIQLADLEYYDACEKALRVCVEQLNAFENDFDGARVGNDSVATLNKVHELLGANADDIYYAKGN